MGGGREGGRDGGEADLAEGEEPFGLDIGCVYAEAVFGTCGRG